MKAKKILLMKAIELVAYHGGYVKFDERKYARPTNSKLVKYKAADIEVGLAAESKELDELTRNYEKASSGAFTKELKEIVIDAVERFVIREQQRHIDRAIADLDYYRATKSKEEFDEILASAKESLAEIAVDEKEKRAITELLDRRYSRGD